MGADDKMTGFSAMLFWRTRFSGLILGVMTTSKGYFNLGCAMIMHPTFLPAGDYIR
jgi:hypothetical protein